MHGSSYGNVFNSMDVTNCDMNGAVIIPECKTIKGKGITSGGTLNTFNFINIRGVLVVCSQRAVSVQYSLYMCRYTCLYMPIHLPGHLPVSLPECLYRLAPRCSRLFTKAVPQWHSPVQ